MNKLLEPCIELAQSAGDAIMAIYKKDDIGQQEKSDSTPVTKADLASNDVLVAGLKALAPDIPIMSEETPIPALAQRKNWQRYWLLDPMDGTGEFILESGDFAVNIALIENILAIKKNTVSIWNNSAFHIFFFIITLRNILINIC